MMVEVQDGDLAKAIKQQLSRLLCAKGFNIVHELPVQLFNSQGCPAEHHLPTFGRGSTLGLVIGNNNALWPHFISQLAAHPAALITDNPLDDLVEATVFHAVQQCLQHLSPHQPWPSQEASSHQQHLSTHPDSSCSCQPPLNTHGACSSLSPSPSSSVQVPATSSIRCAIRFSHHHDPGKFVNMMRAAQLSGLAYYSNTTHLCMHPHFGPWFALRAVAVFDVDGPDPAGFSQLPCPYPDLEAEAAQKMKALEELGGFSSWQQHWKEWAALRALGGKYTDPKYAYSADQLEYHYTKNKDVLRRAVAAWQQQEAHSPSS